MESIKPYYPLLWLVAIGFFMQALDVTIINTALPSMAEALKVSPLKMQAVVVAYSLTMALLMPLSGWLADHWGTQKTFTTAIFVFVAGSLCCAASNSFEALIASRVLQGLGGALLLPIGRLTLIRSLPKSLFLPGMSFVAMPGMLGPLLGPMLGGWLVEYASWRWIFLINVPIGILGGLATLKWMPNLKQAQIHPLDIKGFFILALSMLTLILALDSIAQGHSSYRTVTLACIGITCLVIYFFYAKHKGNKALFSLSLFKVDTYRIGILGNLVARLGSGGLPYLLPLMMQIQFKYSPFESGAMMGVMAVASISARSMTTWVIRRLGYRRVLLLNTWLIGLSLISLAWVNAETSLFMVSFLMALIGLFTSLQFSAMNTLALHDLNAQQASSANSLFSMVLMLSMSIGVAFAAALLNIIHDFTSDQLQTFHLSFLCMGGITFLASIVFLKAPTGSDLDIPKVQAVDAAIHMPKNQ